MAPEAVGAGEGTTVATPTAAPDGNAAEAGATPCPIMRDFDWTAKVASAGGARTLTVSGTIEVNRGGYVAALKPGNSAPFSVLRSGGPSTVTVTPGLRQRLNAQR